MTDYCVELNEKLLAAIPQSKKVLELGCGTGRLGASYKELNPSSQWHGVDADGPSLEAAAKRLDQVWLASLDSIEIANLDGGYDCVVIGDVLEHLKGPERLLSALKRITTADAELVCCVRSVTHISFVESLLIADLHYDDNGRTNHGHLRSFSQSSIFKLFLDSGWLPHLRDQYSLGPTNAELSGKLLRCAISCGVSRQAAERSLFTDRMIISGVRAEETAQGTTLPISVIVPVNNENQFELNLQRSPGLREIGAQILPCRGAKTAADAFARGRVQANGKWLLFCHQDVYFPVGSGFALSKILEAVPPGEADRTVIGFTGIGTNSPQNPYLDTFYAGLIIDRIKRCDWPTADSAVSLDELAIVVHRDTRVEIDPELGWHLWATDLCLAGARAEPPSVLRIVRVPIYHNSLTDFPWALSFYDSAAKLIYKYPTVSGIKSLAAPAGIKAPSFAQRLWRRGRRARVRLARIPFRPRPRGI